MGIWKGIVIGIFLGFGLAALGTYIYFRMGYAPVSTKAPPLPFERFLVHAALQTRLEKASTVPSPVEATEPNLMEGARIYRNSCAFCHGLPGQGKTEVERGMYPQPPELLTGMGVTDDPVGRSHWVISNGIRLTGMPSFEGVLSDQELWQVSLLVAKAHDLPATVKERLQQPDQHLPSSR